MAKRYTVGAVRERLAEALDEAEKGIPVIIERRGVRYGLTVEPHQPRAAGKRGPGIAILDQALRRDAGICTSRQPACSSCSVSVRQL